MKMKTFKAPSMSQALAQVKRTFGSDAVIVNTRTVKSGGWLGLGQRACFEITARLPMPADMPAASKRRTERLRRSYSGAAVVTRHAGRAAGGRPAALRSTPAIPIAQPASLGLAGSETSTTHRAS